MAAIIVVLVVGIICCGVLRLRPVLGGWREAFGASVLCLYGLIWLLTEGASLVSAVRRDVFTLSWLLIAAAAVASVVLMRRQANAAMPWAGLRRPRWGDLSVSEWYMVAGLVAVSGTSLLIAFAAAPNTYDSMTYHLPRVGAWIQNESVAHFPTANSRQNYLAPLAEYAILHLQLVSGTDYLANMPQYLAYLVCLSYVSLVVREFGGSRQAQVVAAMLTATLPVVIYQSSSTQTDLVEAQFAIAFAYYMLIAPRQCGRSWMLLLGLAFGGALCVKGTGFLYTGGLGIVLGAAAIWRSPRPQWRWLVIRRGAVAVVIGGIMLSPVVLRNHASYGKWLGSGEHDYQLGDFRPRALVINVLRSASNHLALPLPQSNEAIESAVNSLLTPDIDEADISWGMPYQVKFWLHEDYMGNPVHALLLLVAVALSLGLKRFRRADLSWYILSLILVAGLLCLLRWQPWITRLQLGLFVLGTPVMAMAYERLSPRVRTPTVVLLASVLWLCAVPLLLRNESRMLVSRGSILVTSRVEQYFNALPFLQDGYTQLIDYTGEMDLDQIGLAVTDNAYEYPVWVLFGKHATGGRGPEIVGVVPDTLGADSPDTVLALEGAMTDELSAAGYVPLKSGEGIILWHRGPAAPVSAEPAAPAAVPGM